MGVWHALILIFGALGTTNIEYRFYDTATYSEGTVINNYEAGSGTRSYEATLSVKHPSDLVYNNKQGLVLNKVNFKVNNKVTVTDQYTVAMFLYRSESEEGYALVLMEDDASQVNIYKLQDRRVEAKVGSGTITHSDPYNAHFPFSEWVHLAFVFSVSECSFYINTNFAFANSCLSPTSFYLHLGASTLNQAALHCTIYSFEFTDTAVTEFSSKVRLGGACSGCNACPINQYYGSSDDPKAGLCLCYPKDGEDQRLTEAHKQCYECKDMKGTSDANCEHCFGQSVRNSGTGLCEGKSNTYWVSDKKKFYNCEDASETEQCNECWPKSFYYLGNCRCPNGFNDVIDAPCISRTCPANSHASGNECYCDTGFKDSDGDYFNVNCVACTGDCKTCIPYSDEDPSDPTQCKCDPGYFDYDPTSAMVCWKCSTSQSQCDKCYGLGSDSQSWTYYYYEKCNCRSGYYDADEGELTDCRPCIENCGKCIDHSTLKDGKCVCASGYYDKEPLSSKIECVLCRSSRYTCTKCDPDAYYLDGECYCPPGKIDADPGVGIRCIECNTDDSSCKLCYPNSEYNPANAQCQCIKGVYYDSDPSEGITCDLCTISDAGCGMCFSGTVLLSGSCQCPLDAYDSNPKAAEFECISCAISEASCQKCFENSVRYDGDCVCKNGFYDSSSVGGLICKPCDESCSTCWGPTYKHCLACKDPNALAKYDAPCHCRAAYYATPNGCSQCMEDCATCSNGTSCDSCRDKNAEVVKGLCQCKENLKTLSTTPLMCSRCPQGTYHEGGQCSGCNPVCLTCERSTYCLTCVNPELVPAEYGGCGPSGSNDGD